MNPPKRTEGLLALRKGWGLLILVACFAPVARGDTGYYRHSFFDNSLTRDAYYYSSGVVSAPSTLTLAHGGKLPVETKIFFTPPNALRLAWTSAAGGAWDAQIDVVRFRNREIRFEGDTLAFWCYTPVAVAAADLPMIRVQDTGFNFSGPLRWNSFGGDLPAGRWTHVTLPL